MRVALYLRLPTNEELRADSLATQEEFLREGFDAASDRRHECSRRFRFCVVEKDCPGDTPNTWNEHPAMDVDSRRILVPRHAFRFHVFLSILTVR